MTNEAAERMQLTIEDGVEREVDAAIDYLCDECTTPEMEVWHERAI